METVDLLVPNTKKFKCKHCEHISRSMASLKEHMKSQHGELYLSRARFKCKYCDFAGSSQALLQCHRKKNHEDTNWRKCEFCSFNAQNSYTMTNHMKSSHIESYKCEHCSIKTKYKSVLINHIELKHGSTESVHYFRAIECNNPLVRDKTWCEHNYFKTSSSTSVETMWFCCRFCNFKTKNAKEIPVHLHLKHILPKSRIDTFICKLKIPEKFKCEFCEFNTNLKVILTQHLRVFHDGKEVNKSLDSVLQVYWCSYCDFTTYSVFVLMKHAQNCNRVCKTNSNMHEEDMSADNMWFEFILSGVRWFCCKQCRYQTPYSDQMERHIKAFNCHRFKVDDVIVNANELAISTNMPIKNIETTKRSRKI